MGRCLLFILIALSTMLAACGGGGGGNGGTEPDTPGPGQFEVVPIDWIGGEPITDVSREISFRRYGDNLYLCIDRADRIGLVEQFWRLESGQAELVKVKGTDEPFIELASVKREGATPDSLRPDWWSIEGTKAARVVAEDGTPKASSWREAYNSNGRIENHHLGSNLITSGRTLVEDSDANWWIIEDGVAQKHPKTATVSNIEILERQGWVFRSIPGGLLAWTNDRQNTGRNFIPMHALIVTEEDVRELRGLPEDGRCDWLASFVVDDELWVEFVAEAPDVDSPYRLCRLVGEEFQEIETDAIGRVEYMRGVPGGGVIAFTNEWVDGQTLPRLDYLVDGKVLTWGSDGFAEGAEPIAVGVRGRFDDGGVMLLNLKSNQYVLADPEGKTYRELRFVDDKFHELQFFEFGGLLVSTGNGLGGLPRRHEYENDQHVCFRVKDDLIYSANEYHPELGTPYKFMRAGEDYYLVERGAKGGFLYARHRDD